MMGNYVTLILAITLYGKDWKKVEQTVGTRNGSQVRSHAQKFFNKLKKDEKMNPTGKKGGEGFQDLDISENENSFMKAYPEGISNTTPVELVSIIRKQSQDGCTMCPIFRKNKSIKVKTIVAGPDDHL